MESSLLRSIRALRLSTHSRLPLPTPAAAAASRPAYALSRTPARSVSFTSPSSLTTLGRDLSSGQSTLTRNSLASESITAQYDPSVSASTLLSGQHMAPQPHHLHVYAHKHNTHITLTAPDRKAILSISTGNIGFRKSQRGTYDAAYQLGAYVMARVQRDGLVPKIRELELVLRGFGQGRDAVSKILTGQEGVVLRGKIIRVVDATRLKFGGTRSPRPRRLG